MTMRSHSDRSWLFRLAIPALSALLAFGVARYLHHPNRGEPLAIPAERLHFGEQWTQSQFQWELPIRNTTGESITVSEFSADCSCTNISPAAFTLGPGEEITVSLLINLVPEAPTESGSTHEFSVGIRAQFAEPIRGARTEWRLTGSIRELFSGFPRSVVMTSSQGPDGLYQPQRFPVHLIEAGCQIAASVDQPVADLELEPSADDPMLWELVVTPKSTLTIGSHGTPLRLHALDQSGRAIPDYDSWLALTIVEDLSLDPSVVSLGRLKVSANGETTALRLESRSGAPIRSLQVRVPDPNPDIEAHVDGAPSRDAPDQWTIPIRLIPKAAGEHVEAVSLELTSDNVVTRLPVHVQWELEVP